MDAPPKRDADDPMIQSPLSEKLLEAPHVRGPFDQHEHAIAELRRRSVFGPLCSASGGVDPRACALRGHFGARSRTMRCVDDERRIELSPPVRAGLLQGLAQGVLWGIGLRLGQWGFFCSRVPRPQLLWVVITGALVLTALGAWIDLRRRERRLAMIASPRARAGGFAVACVVVATCGALTGSPEGFLCVGMSALPALTLVVDRMLGPAWVIAERLRIEHARRGWARVEVVATEPTLLVVMPDGTAERARSEVPLELGGHYARLARAEDRGHPYRKADPITLLETESVETRAQRAHERTTAILALVSGLAWLALAFGPSVGAALSVAPGAHCGDPQ